MPADGGLLPLLGLGLGAIGSAATHDKPLAVSNGPLDRIIKIVFLLVFLGLTLLAGLMLYAYTTSARAAEAPERWCYAPGGVVDRCGQTQPTAVRDAAGRWVLGVGREDLGQYGWYREVRKKKEWYQKESDTPTLDAGEGTATYPVVTPPVPPEREAIYLYSVAPDDPPRAIWFRKVFPSKLPYQVYGDVPVLDAAASTATYPVVDGDPEEAEAYLLAQFQLGLQLERRKQEVLVTTGAALPVGSVQADTVQKLLLMRSTELLRQELTGTPEERAAATAELDLLAEKPDQVRALYAREAEITNWVRVALEPEEYADYLGPSRADRWPDGPWFD